MENNKYLLSFDLNKKGFNEYVNPNNSALKYTSGGILILEEGETYEVGFDNQEIGLICTEGTGTAMLDCESNTDVVKFDSFFIPPGKSIVFTGKGLFKLVWFSSPSSAAGEPVYISYKDIENDPSRKVHAGSKETSTERSVNMLINEDIKASRLLAGITVGAEGNWTSWPPHQHGDTREELYIYFDMPHPYYGIQVIYKDSHEPLFCGVVRDGIAVAVPGGFHPNVAVPGCKLSYIYIMASLKENEYRTFRNVELEKGLGDTFL